MLDCTQYMDCCLRETVTTWQTDNGSEREWKHERNNKVVVTWWFVSRLTMANDVVDPCWRWIRIRSTLVVDDQRGAQHQEVVGQ